MLHKCSRVVIGDKCVNDFQQMKALQYNGKNKSVYNVTWTEYMANSTFVFKKIQRTFFYRGNLLI